VSVTTVYNGDADSTAHSLGANYQWQRAVNDLYYNDGNVGIGNTSPSAKLHVKTAISTVYANVVPSIANTILAISNTQTSETTNDQAQIQFGVNGGTHNRVGSIGLIAESASNRKAALVFATDDAGTRAEKMRIASDGNVGIGTTAPTGAKLQVAGGIRISNGSKVYLYTSNDLNYLTYNRWQVHTGTALAIDNTSTGGFQVQNSGTAVLFVGTDSTYGGRVGINTVNPTSLLHVKGSTGSTFISVQDSRSNTDDVAGVRFSTSANATVNFKSFISHIETGTNGQGDLIFAVNNSNTAVDATVSDERMRIKQSGKIRLNEYGEGDFTSGTVTYRLAVNASGDVMEIPIGDGPVDGSGTEDYVARWTDTETLGIGKIRDDNSTVAINTAPDSSYMLKVAGNGYFSGTLTEASSLAIKENIENFTPSIDKINKIRPVKYNKKGSDKKEIGLIAEELEELFPELVEKDENGNPSGVNYSRAVTVLLGGFKELYKELQEIKKRI